MSIQPSVPLSDIASNGKNSNILPTAIIKKLRNCNNHEADILQTSVEIIYQALECDRVLVYSLQSESLCKIVAEAVTPGFAQILGKTIQDSCFEERYIDLYQKGRVRAITNIREAGMTPCYVENLERLDVKSNLVVPLIRFDSSLYGLLVMHQCSKIRQWKQPEVEFALQMADWTIERLFESKKYLKLESRLQNQEKAQQMITGITQEIHSAITFDQVLQLGVDKAKALLNCDRVVVYGLQTQSMGKIVAEATIPALASILGSVIKDPCFEYRYLDQYQQGRVRATSNIYEAGMTPCYIDNLAKIGVKSNLVAPINWDNGKIYGLLVAHQCFSYKEWEAEEIEYFRQIGFHVGLSLSKAKLKEQSYTIQTGFTQLNKINENLALAKSKIQRLKQSSYNTNQIFSEIDNLNKLLLREINLINQNSAPQTQKDTKLIQIMLKKLVVTTSKLKQYINDSDNSKNEVDLLLGETISDISENKADRN
jgi:methyl-accepting chemotaxis protein PixJ